VAPEGPIQPIRDIQAEERGPQESHVVDPNGAPVGAGTHHNGLRAPCAPPWRLSGRQGRIEGGERHSGPLFAVAGRTPKDVHGALTTAPDFRARLTARRRSVASTNGKRLESRIYGGGIGLTAAASMTATTSAS
jgi:hypothetical protein